MVHTSNTEMVYFKGCLYLTCGIGCNEWYIRTFKHCFIDEI